MLPYRSGSGQPFVQVGPLMSANVRWPSEEARLRIAPSLSALSEREALTEEESQVLAQTRDALLPALMSGRLRVKDAETIVEDVV